MDSVFISKNKYDELKLELSELQKSLLKDNEEATKMGGPMDSYKEAAAIQVSLGAKRQKVTELEDIMKRIEILPEQVPGDKIVLGKYFTIDNGEKQIRYRLVHPVEANPTLNLVSVDAPLGKAVINQVAGYEFILNTRTFRIIKIH